ncbi:hypothetical protein QCA50_020176 [Cerrena zonata]|uniref:Uncharacterized protein n=1 Tax=Cerrena zonata TaxID=2478898 RepID=A0AAW0FJL7_9APHY
MPGLPKTIDEFTLRFKENIGKMFPRAVLNPTRHMEKFMDMANVDNYLHDKHLYAITERGKKNLPEMTPLTECASSGGNWCNTAPLRTMGLLSLWSPLPALMV